jgi:hypothetical protein
MPKAFPIEFRRDVVAVARKGEAPVNGQVFVPGGGQLKVPTPRAGSGLAHGDPFPGPGFAHAVGVAVGDDDAGVVQQPV